MQPLEDGLEGLIESGKMPEDHTPVGAYLRSNPTAREEVASMMDLSRLIRENFALSADERDSLEVAPGFYARVLARIDAQAPPPSIWNFFLEPFGRRLVYASLALALLFVPLMLTVAYVGPAYSAVHAIVPPHMRALAISCLIGALTLFGASIGPPLVGAISDWLAPQYGNGSLAMAMLLLLPVTLLLSAWQFHAAARHLPADLYIAPAAAPARIDMEREQ